MNFAGKTVWITGASSGIGAALARAFSAAGADIIASGRRESALKAVAADLSGDCFILPFEVTDFEKLSGIVEAAYGWRDQIDILVNNAGVSQRSLAVETSPEVYTRLIDIDLLAPIWLTQLTLPKMVAAGGGHIVAISSVAGRVGAPLRTAYSAAKHGLIGYMDALRTEVTKPHNIYVTNILPGSVATDVSRNALTASGAARGKSDANIDNGDDPAECAAAILQAVSDKMPELIFASGMELMIAKMRHEDPDKLFEITAEFGTEIVARYSAGDDS